MPTLLHLRGVVPILPQARIRVDAKGKLPKTPRSMHCTVSRTRLGIKETEKFQDAGRRAGGGGLQFPSGPPLRPHQQSSRPGGNDWHSLTCQIEVWTLANRSDGVVHGSEKLGSGWHGPC